MRLLRVALLTGALATLQIAMASAQENRFYPTRVTNVSSPLAITSCRASFQNAYKFSVNIRNRSRFAILSFSVRLFYYDSSGSQMGQDDFEFTPPDTLVPGDSGSYDQLMGGNNEPWQALGSVVCRPQSTTLTGHHHWSYGQKWVGALGASPTTSRGSYASAISNVANSFPTTGSAKSVKVRVVKTWSDTVNGTIYVHDQIEATAPTSSILRPGELVLSYADATGATHTLHGLVQAPPQYQKINVVTGDVELHPEIDPSVDLGTLGSLVIQAGTTRTAVVTFAVPSGSSGGFEKVSVVP
mgnify:CR=1 FL=1